MSARPEDGADGPPVAAKSKPQPVVPQEKSLPFYPPVPTVLPDLNQGYLFNAERFLPGEKDSVTPAEEDGEAGTEVAVDIETMFYAGSIITGDVRKGLIVYPALAGPATPAQKGEPVVAAASPQKPRKYAEIAPGDTVSGYSVVAVEADRLVLQKGEETIEKLLNDPKKERIVPPPPPKPQAAPKPAAPPAATPAVTRATGVSPAVRRTPPTQRVNAPRRLPANMSIQVPGSPR
ncbi:MAG: hypothetical protein ACOY4H_10235 [Thermodesulfobacteriota bacterium]